MKLVPASFLVYLGWESRLGFPTATSALNLSSRLQAESLGQRKQRRKQKQTPFGQSSNVNRKEKLAHSLERKLSKKKQKGSIRF